MAKKDKGMDGYSYKVPAEKLKKIQDSSAKMGYKQEFGEGRMSPGKMGDHAAAKMLKGDAAAKYYSGPGDMHMNGAAKYTGAAKHGKPHDDKKPTTLQRFRNSVEPGLSSNQTGNSRQQLFDADGDGDTVFNDSNQDGTMLSRGIGSAVDFMKRNFPMESGPTRPIFKDGKLNFDASLMDKVGTGMD